ncbi:hypothetical protein [Marinimicrobium sp. C2-29]|uniref:hypothetical protein n=1 Tax=Marinimicrobium sp. C2-29 TaxID=3139825 RepID=UPI00313A2A87
MKSGIRPAGVHQGTFFGWLETGLGALQSDDDDSMDGLVILEKSDWVEIRDNSGKVVFVGEIKPDYEAGKELVDSPLARSKPRALGCVVYIGHKKGLSRMPGVDFSYQMTSM